MNLEEMKQYCIEKFKNIRLFVSQKNYDVAIMAADTGIGKLEEAGKNPNSELNSANDDFADLY